MNESNNYKSVEYLKALSSPLRLQILLTLADNSYCVSGIAKKLSVNQATASIQLKILKSAGIILKSKHDGKTFYSITNLEVFRLISIFCGSL